MSGICAWSLNSTLDATFAFGSTTIASIPVTTAIVVIVITLAVTLPRVYLHTTKDSEIVSYRSNSSNKWF